MDLGKNLNLEKERIQSELNSKQSEINKLHQENVILKRKLKIISLKRPYARKLEIETSSNNDSKIDKYDSGRESELENNDNNCTNGQESDSRFKDDINDEETHKDNDTLEDQENRVQTVTCYISCFL